MQLATAEKLARRLYWGDLDEAGRPYVDHLARTAALVASYGGDECAQLAAWLHDHGQPPVTAQELAAQSVPRRVIRIIEALSPTMAWEPLDTQAAKIRVCPGAIVVLRADAADMCTPEPLAALKRGMWRQRCDRYRRLLAELGEAEPVIPPGTRHERPFNVDELLSQLTPDSPARWEAVRRLGSVGELRAAGRLIDAYLAALRGQSVWASGKAQLAGAVSQIAAHRRNQDNPEWVRTLVGLASHSDPFLRATAIRGLAGLAEQSPIVLRGLADDDPQVAYAAVSALDARQIGEHAQDLGVIAARQGRAWTWPRRRAIQRLLAAGCPPGCDVMLAAVAADGMELGTGTVTAFARQCGQSVIPQLIDLIREGVRGRAAAAFVLGEVRARDAVAELAAVLGEGRDDLLLVLACLEALAKIGDPSAAPALTWAARHRLAFVRAAALTAMSKLGDVDVTEVALEATEDFDPDVREKAVRLLAARGDQRATGRLLLFCDGPLAAAALKGLIRIADERAVPALRRVLLDSPDRRIRHLAGQALARSARSATLLYPGWWLTSSQLRALAWVLGEIGDRSSGRGLCRLLEHRDELVRARAAAALGKIGDTEAAPALWEASGDISPRVRANTATAIGRLHASETAEWLEAMLSDPHPAVRAAARAAKQQSR